MKTQYKNKEERNLSFRCRVCRKDFTTSLRNLINKKNCHGCGARKHAYLQDAEKYASEREGGVFRWGGPLASSQSKWICKSGHVWTASWSRVRTTQSWCHKCKQRFVGSEKERSEREERILSDKAWDTYRRRDLVKNREFNISKEDVRLARMSFCVYCKNRKASGFDRIDNALGHIQGNCVPCCIRCNWVRGNWLTHEVMLKVGLLLEKIDP